ncbi:hypothetical protein F4820DRAFT_464386 [Hypoxylon rubiginosum]|uniref:Uncharacterized protein n=1 Tax=Hypoxylon rubiginosum TaxID=110542 RepID=A0ACB9YRY0_9PEZI|nr:hypothetical protein F4820DRAFT_464386 [Hypoxylon rubiginosum]
MEKQDSKEDSQEQATEELNISEILAEAQKYEDGIKEHSEQIELHAKIFGELTFEGLSCLSTFQGADIFKDSRQSYGDLEVCREDEGWSGPHNEIRGRLGPVAELQYLFSGTKYAIINFYTNEEEAIEANFTLAKLADEYFIPKVLCFGQIHWDDAKDLAENYYKKAATRHILVFFKDGKNFAVNGRDTIYGSGSAGWKGAIEKLGAEARKHVEQAKR